MDATATLFEKAEDKQLFAETIIEIIEKQHQEYEREHKESGYERVPLANIHFEIVRTGTRDFAGIGNFYGNTGVPCLQEIAKMQGKPNENLLITAQRMLDLFCCEGEIIELCIDNRKVYKLSKDGLLYKHLAGKLAST